ncbi:hypothetical protein GGX14DRAFT_586140 [Mycena pura]|uniref:Uncharacterized protein n=1 Tax=Mycena pura TaxID=153505 RepID=A0AAD6VS01_9AGAR|nr:hypothetical protein GGX14DRAFT_586140 [Mycena pura]
MSGSSSDGSMQPEELRDRIRKAEEESRNLRTQNSVLELRARELESELSAAQAKLSAAQEKLSVTHAKLLQMQAVLATGKLAFDESMQVVERACAASTTAINNLDQALRDTRLKREIKSQRAVACEWLGDAISGRVAGAATPVLATGGVNLKSIGLRALAVCPPPLLDDRHGGCVRGFGGCKGLDVEIARHGELVLITIHESPIVVLSLVTRAVIAFLVPTAHLSADALDLYNIRVAQTVLALTGLRRPPPDPDRGSPTAPPCSPEVSGVNNDGRRRRVQQRGRDNIRGDNSRPRVLLYSTCMASASMYSKRSDTATYQCPGALLCHTRHALHPPATHFLRPENRCGVPSESGRRLALSLRVSLALSGAQGGLLTGPVASDLQVAVARPTARSPRSRL